MCVRARARPCMRATSRRCTALLFAETRWCLTRSKLNGQMGLSEFTHHRQIPLQRYKNFKIIIILWVTFKVGLLYCPFVTILQIFLELRQAEILLWS